MHPPAGLHVHHGSEINRASTFRALMSGLNELARRLPQPPRIINLGGGWHALDEAELPGLFADLRAAVPADCDILIEPGRWYGKGAGLAVGSIVNRQGNDGGRRPRRRRPERTASAPSSSAAPRSTTSRTSTSSSRATSSWS